MNALNNDITRNPNPQKALIEFKVPVLLRTILTMSDSMKSVLIIGVAQVPPKNQSSENSQ